MASVENLSNQTKSDNNFAELVRMQHTCLMKGPAIPHIGVYLGQLTFAYEGNQNDIDGLVSFTKCVLVYQIIGKILSFQIQQETSGIIEQVHQKLRQPALVIKSLLVEKSKLDRVEFLAMYEAEK
jgi:hypothetical protein